MWSRQIYADRLHTDKQNSYFSSINKEKKALLYSKINKTITIDKTFTPFCVG